MVRTDTIKRRWLDVYLDLLKQEEELAEAAKKRGTSFSKFIQECAMGHGDIVIVNKKCGRRHSISIQRCLS